MSSRRKVFISLGALFFIVVTAIALLWYIGVTEGAEPFRMMR